ncbi:MAG: hypothetical protein ABI169_01530, partial [Chitinophagaceae bacterium]
GHLLGVPLSMSPKIVLGAILLSGFFSCKSPSSSTENVKLRISAPLTQLSATQYPDNPDLSIQSNLNGKYIHESILLIQDTSGKFTLVMPPANALSDTIILPNIDLAEMIPSIPDNLKKDEYLQEIGLINQEWNRQQVSFTPDEFVVSGKGKEKQVVSRIDLARNCLNAGLWEVIAYTKEGEDTKPYYHGWFSFPKEEYHKLFEKRNDIPYSKWASHLDNWIDPESKEINLPLIRTVLSEKSVPFQNLNNGFYPMTGERKKKFKNIITPKNPTNINDFLNDSTLFATFAPPGIYKRSDPRKTKLSMLFKPVNVMERQVVSNKDTVTELDISFQRRGSDEITRFVVGGINLKTLQHEDFQTTDKGWQMPMGIADHTFYESYPNALKNASKKSPFYAFLLTKDGKWLDSHFIGIDGPLMYLDVKDPHQLHFWILAFERHAFVGHYVVNI